MSKPAPFRGTPRIPGVHREGHAVVRLIEEEVVNTPPPSFPKAAKHFRGEPEIPPLIKVRVNEFPACDSASSSDDFHSALQAQAREALSSSSLVSGSSEPPPAFRMVRESLKRTPRALGPDGAVTDVGQVGMHVDSVRGIFLTQQKLSQMSKLWTIVQRYAHLQSLVLVECGLSKLEPIELPSLRLLNLSGNQISKEAVVVKFLKPLQNVQEVDLRGNPVKDMAALCEKATAVLSAVEVVNGQSVDLEQRVRCVEAHRKHGKALSPSVRWYWTISSLPGVSGKVSWNPHSLRKLMLPQCNLSVFHVRQFVNLEVLDLSHNAISTVLDSGLAFCEALRTCDLRHNQLVKRDQLTGFQFNVELLSLNLSGNEVCKVKDYRSHVIYLTRACRGDNRSLGLLRLDGTPITIEERCLAHELLAPSSKSKAAELEALRWNWTAVEYFGRAEMAACPSEARYCILPDRKLATAALSPFVNIRVLDLSRNALTSLVGLQALTHLIFVDLSNNPRLNLAAVLGQFETRSLQQVVFHVTDDKKHARSDPRKAAYRNLILNALLMKNPHLNYVDEILIEPTERIDTYARMGASPEQVELYRFRLACALQALKLPRVLHPAFLDPERKPYARSAVSRLTRLADFGLSVVDFSPFTSLQVLCVRGNKLTDFEAMKLRNLPRLKKLDVSHNLISNKLHALAFFIDEMTSLQVLHLEGNPCMKTPEDRAKLIACMDSMKEDDPHLKRLDGEVVTIRERISVLTAQGVMSKEAGEELRYRSIAVNFLPLDLDATKVTRLDFSDTGLRAMGLGKYVNLRVLLLRGNDIRTVLSIQGFESLAHLEVLDLRHNLLSSLNEIVDLIQDKVPEIQSLGLAGNRLPKDYRQRLLVELKSLHQRASPFNSLDDVEITPDELFAAAQRAGTTKAFKNLQQYRLDLALFRRVPPNGTQGLTELDLSNVGLELFHLDDFPSLRKLSLAHNLLSNKTLVACQLASLTSLYWLNLSFNKIRNLDSLASTLAPLTQLIDLNFAGNSCCGNLSRVEMGKRFERLSHATCPLVFLNDAELTVEERCDIALALGRKDLDLFRLQVCAYLRNVNEEATSLDLSRCGLRTLGGLQIFTHLVALDLSRNGCTVFEKHVFAYMPGLKYLDLHDNELDCSLSTLTDSLVVCSHLATLHLLNSLHDGSTARRNQYLVKVFEALPSLLKLDGHKRSVGDGLATAAAAAAAALGLNRDIKSRGSTSARQSASSSAANTPNTERRKRKSIRKTRTGDQRKLSASSPGSPVVVPHIPHLSMSTSAVESDTQSSPSSGGGSGGRRPSSGGRRASSPKGAVNRSNRPLSPSSSSTAVASSSSPPAVASPSLKSRRSHKRAPSSGTKSPGRKKEDTVGSVQRHRRSGSTGTKTVKEQDTLGVPVGPPPARSPPSGRRASVKRSGGGGSIRRSSSRGLGASSDNATVTPVPVAAMSSSPPAAPSGIDLAHLIAVSEEKARQQAIADLEAMQVGGNGEDLAIEDSVDPSVDESVVNNAAQLLRSLDFGLGSQSGSHGAEPNSDEEYAESDEAEWNDLSFEEEVEEEDPQPNRGQVDRRLILRELEMFRIVEGPEVEEEMEVEEGSATNASSPGGAYLDKFDLGTARGSSTHRSLRGSSHTKETRAGKSGGSLRGDMHK